MGIVNVTPDSFSDGGRWANAEAAVEHALALAEAGADILDIGGESTRPGAEPVPLEIERERVLPVVQRLVSLTPVPLSIDTMKAEIARECLALGAAIVNDVSGLRADPAMPAVVLSYAAGAVVMHMQGTPQTMQHNPSYVDVVREVGEFFEQRCRELTAAGIGEETLCLDPGVGFGKTHDHNFRLLTQLPKLRIRGRPLLLGVSRKGFIGTVTGRPRQHRLAGSLALGCFALAAGGAQILRVHDVAAARDAVLLWQEWQRHS